MADLINLRAARKQAARHQAEQQAARNRLTHGVAAVERKRETAQRTRAERSLEAHRLDDGEQQ